MAYKEFGATIAPSNVSSTGFPIAMGTHIGGGRIVNDKSTLNLKHWCLLGEGATLNNQKANAIGQIWYDTSDNKYWKLDSWASENPVWVDISTIFATRSYVDTAINDIPDPMIFKGSLGTGGTITSLPTASSSNTGFTYKVITAGTYAGQTAKVGDTFISDGTTWNLIPSGDEPSGTVTSITLNATSPILIDNSTAITTSGTRTFSHDNSSGNKHIPSGGSTNQILRWTADGTAVWSNEVNTHYTSKNIVSSSPTGITNTNTTNPYLNHIEESTVTSSHRINGSGATTVSSDVGGNITINSTDTTYSFATGTTNGTFNVTPSGGSATAISIYGLGSAAYTSSTNYALSSHNHSVFTTTEDGFVPKSVTSNTTDFLRRDGTWATPSSTTYTLPLAASGTRGGIQIGYTATGANLPLLLSSEKAYVTLTSSSITTALGYTPNTGTVTSITLNATSPILIDSTTAITTSGTRTFSHASTSGNKHIPSGGSANNYLKWDSDGTGVWSTLPTASTSVAGITTVGANGGAASYVHTHVKSDITDFDHNHDALYAKVGNSFYYVVGNTTGVAGTWTGTINEVTSLYAGLTIAYKIGIAGASATTLNINSLGPNTVVRNTNNLTTHLPAGTVVVLTFDRTYWNNTITAGATIYDYKLLAQGLDGKFYPLTLEEGTGTTKTISTQEFEINTQILYYGSTTNVIANSTTANVYSEFPVSTLSYTANQTSWTSQLPIYLVGIVQANGNIKLDNSSYTSFMTQTLPTTANGKVYIMLGYMYSTTGMRLFQYHPMYEYRDGALRVYMPAHSHGNITDSGAIGTTSGLMVKTTTSGVLTTLPAGTSGQFLQYDGTWATPNTGTVTSITTGTGLSGGPITTTGDIKLAAEYGDIINPYGSKFAKYVLAAPNTSDGVPSFRELVASDIPLLNQNTSGTAGSVSNSITFNDGGTGDTSGITYNGTTARTISYNTIGAASKGRTITAGNGLTGGGNLTTDISITLGTPSTITGSTTNNVTSTSHTHAISLTPANIGAAPSNHNHDYSLLDNLPAIYNANHDGVPDTDFDILYTKQNDIWMCESSMKNGPLNDGGDTNSSYNTAFDGCVIQQFGDNGTKIQVLYITTDDVTNLSIGGMFYRVQGEKWMRVATYLDIANLQASINNLTTTVNNKQNKMTEALGSPYTVLQTNSYNRQPIVPEPNIVKAYNNDDSTTQYYIINAYVNSLEEAIIIINDNSNLNTKFNIAVNSSYKISGPFTPNVDFIGPMILTIWRGTILSTLRS